MEKNGLAPRLVDQGGRIHITAIAPEGPPHVLALIKYKLGRHPEWTLRATDQTTGSVVASRSFPLARLRDATHEFASEIARHLRVVPAKGERPIAE